ncbi:MAG: hypothetical protein ACTSUI_00605 [Promethearchaeota archaeon]
MVKTTKKVKLHTKAELVRENKYLSRQLKTLKQKSGPIALKNLEVKTAAAMKIQNELIKKLNKTLAEKDKIIAELSKKE